jgi:hypothetical protein
VRHGEYAGGFPSQGPKLGNNCWPIGQDLFKWLISASHFSDFSISVRALRTAFARGIVENTPEGRAQHPLDFALIYAGRDTEALSSAVEAFAIGLNALGFHTARGSEIESSGEHDSCASVKTLIPIAAGELVKSAKAFRRMRTCAAVFLNYTFKDGSPFSVTHLSSQFSTSRPAMRVNSLTLSVTSVRPSP